MIGLLLRALSLNNARAKIVCRMTKNIDEGLKKHFKLAFTVVELLIVVAVIGILAALSVVAYSSVQKAARDKSVLSDIDAIDGAETDYGLKNNIGGVAYNSGNSGDVALLRFTPSPGNVIDVATDGTDYCIRGYNPAGTKDSLINAAIKETTPGICASLNPTGGGSVIAVVQKGWSQQVLGTGSPSVLSATTAFAETGDLLVAAFCIANTSGVMVPPTGWTQIVARTTMGTRGIQVFAKIRESSDGSTYSFGVPAAFARRGVLIALDNTAASVSNLVVGSLGIRNVNGTSFTNVAPSITTAVNNTYVLTISAEATTADDTVAPSVTAGGATSWFWTDDTSTLETFTVAYLEQASAGPTSPITITYQNTQASNGAAFQLGIPPTPPS
jgi:prepilin-type N-terminal cleavage/methylation domain-containing protein